MLPPHGRSPTPTRARAAAHVGRTRRLDRPGARAVTDAAGPHRRRSLILAAVVAVAAAGLASAVGRDTSVVGVPPSPASWPAYPRLPTSCWARPGADVMRSAPSDLDVFARGPRAPGAIVQAVLRGLAGRRLVRSVRLGPLPLRVQAHARGWLGSRRLPAGALWAGLDVPALRGAASPRDQMLADWELTLVVGALRDRLCAARGRPLAGWTVNGLPGGVSDGGQAFGQVFPNPSHAVFRRRLHDAAQRYGFRVRTAVMSRPLRDAPMVVVQTRRDRKAFVRDIPAIVEALDPTARTRDATATTYEGLFLEAVDADGAFVRVDTAYRGEVMGAQWSWDRRVTPYRHSAPPGAAPCPT